MKLERVTVVREELKSHLASLPDRPSSWGSELAGSTAFCWGAVNLVTGDCFVTCLCCSLPDTECFNSYIYYTEEGNKRAS